MNAWGVAFGSAWGDAWGTGAPVPAVSFGQLFWPSGETKEGRKTRIKREREELGILPTEVAQVARQVLAERKKRPLEVRQVVPRFVRALERKHIEPDPEFIRVVEQFIQRIKRMQDEEALVLLIH